MQTKDLEPAALIDTLLNPFAPEPPVTPVRI